MYLRGGGYISAGPCLPGATRLRSMALQSANLLSSRSCLPVCQTACLPVWYTVQLLVRDQQAWLIGILLIWASCSPPGSRFNPPPPPCVLPGVAQGIPDTSQCHPGAFQCLQYASKCLPEVSQMLPDAFQTLPKYRFSSIFLEFPRITALPAIADAWTAIGDA